MNNVFVLCAIEGDEACINDPDYKPAQAVFSYGPDLLDLVGERWQQWSLGGALEAANPKGFYLHTLNLFEYYY